MSDLKLIGLIVLVAWVGVCAGLFLFNHGAHKDNGDKDDGVDQ